MENKDIIISRIQQNFKHNQLTTGLSKLGPDVHSLEVVARLVSVEKGEVSDQWAKIYFSFLDQAHRFKISERAEECYDLLVAC